MRGEKTTLPRLATACPAKSSDSPRRPFLTHDAQQSDTSTVRSIWMLFEGVAHVQETCRCHVVRVGGALCARCLACSPLLRLLYGVSCLRSRGLPLLGRTPLVVSVIG